MDALRLLEIHPEVEFERELVPAGPASDGVWVYAVPPEGDVVTRVSARGASIREARVEIMGEVVHAAPGRDARVEMPVRINLMRLGYHRATIRVFGSEVVASVTFRLHSDIEARRKIATAEPVFALSSGP